MNPKYKVWFHLVAQILGQAAVAALVPPGAEKYYSAIVAVIGVIVAFYDTTTSNTPAA